jgi:hypothetical protein
MLSLAIKNAILVILIILILHFLIKNYLVNQSYERHERQEEDEDSQIKEESLHKGGGGNAHNGRSNKGLERFTVEPTSRNQQKGNPDKDEIDLYNFIQSKKPLSDISGHQKSTKENGHEGSEKMSSFTTDTFQPQPMSFGNYAPLL